MVFGGFVLGSLADPLAQKIGRNGNDRDGDDYEYNKRNMHIDLRSKMTCMKILIWIQSEKSVSRMFFSNV